jgi:glycosyltransferase involved in cell wall biosynthesis
MVRYQLTREPRAIRALAVVSTYPPTRCGLATFSAALVAALRTQLPAATVGVVEIVEQPFPRRNPDVVGQFAGGDERAVAAATAAIAGFDAAVVQHEYGIYAGPDGVAVVRLLERLAVPVVTVLHTVLSEPSRSQRQVLERVITSSDAVVVMADTARERLLARYQVEPDRVHVITHGATVPRDSAPPRRDDRPTMLTWGLLGPGKGIEHAIDALAWLRDLRPLPRYVVAGQIHPKVSERAGASYRSMLMARARYRGVAEMLELDNRYLSREALTTLIRQADVVVLPYESREQVTSGVLVDAVACGRPVVATAFPHAVELLQRGAGLTVPHDGVAALAGALRSVLVDPHLAARLRGRAEQIAPELSWDTVAGRYLALAGGVAATRSPVVL